MCTSRRIRLYICSIYRMYVLLYVLLLVMSKVREVRYDHKCVLLDLEQDHRLRASASVSLLELSRVLFTLYQRRNHAHAHSKKEEKQHKKNVEARIYRLVRLCGGLTSECTLRMCIFCVCVMCMLCFCWVYPSPCVIRVEALELSGYFQIGRRRRSTVQYMDGTDPHMFSCKPRREHIE